VYGLSLQSFAWYRKIPGQLQIINIQKAANDFTAHRAAHLYHILLNIRRHHFFRLMVMAWGCSIYFFHYFVDVFRHRYQKDGSLYELICIWKDLFIGLFYTELR